MLLMMFYKDGKNLLTIYSCVATILQTSSLTRPFWSFSVVVGSLFECLYHCDVVHWALPFCHPFRAQFFEHASPHRFVELLVELLGAPLLSQPLLLEQGASVDLEVVVPQLRRGNAEWIGRRPFPSLLVELETVQDDLVFLVFFEG